MAVYVRPGIGAAKTRIPRACEVERSIAQCVRYLYFFCLHACLDCRDSSVEFLVKRESSSKQTFDRFIGGFHK